jgi:hypothetical protein
MNREPYPELRDCIASSISEVVSIFWLDMPYVNGLLLTLACNGLQLELVRLRALSTEY